MSIASDYYVYNYADKIESIDLIQEAVGDSIYVPERGRVLWEFCRFCNSSRFDVGYNKKKLYVYVSISNGSYSNVELYGAGYWQKIYTFCSKQCLEFFCLHESVTPEYPEVKFLWKDSIVNFMHNLV